MAKKRSNEEGSALIFALILILVLSVMGTSLMFVSQSETWSSMNYRMMTQARYGAESGLNVAADFIVNPNSYTPPTGVALNSFDITVSPVKYNGQPVTLSSISGQSNYPSAAVVSAFHNALTTPGSVTAGNTTVNYSATATLLSMGTVNSYGNTVTVQTWQLTGDGTINSVRNSKEEVTTIMEQQVTPATVYAAFATSSGCSALKFAGSGTTQTYGMTNSYDSSKLAVNAAGVATIPTTFNAFGGNVGANGNMVENGSGVTINGTLSTPDTGVGNCSSGSVTALSGNGTVSGGLVKLPQIVVFPTPIIPPPSTTSYDNHNAPPNPLPPGSYADISLSGSMQLDLVPGTYNINSISANGANTSVLIMPDPITHQYGPVIMNVTGANQTTPINLGGNGLENPTLNPALLQINYAGTGNINLNGNTQSAAVIYAPNAYIAITGGSDFYGAVLGNVVNDKGGAAIHYDLNLSKNTYVVSNFMLGAFNWAKF